MTPWIVIAALAGKVVAPQTPEMLVPSGKWTVDYAASMCVLQRDYGTGPAQVTLGFRPMPLSEQSEIVLVTRAAGERAASVRFDKVSLQLGVAGPVIAGTYRLLETKTTPELHYTQISVNAAEAEDIAGAETLFIEREKLPTVRLRLMATPAAVSALKACQNDLLKSWGIDLPAIAKIATPAVGKDKADWIMASDYPYQSIRAGEAGTVSILWTVGIDGNPSDCRVTQTSGHPSLDQAACNAILRRGRYTPALDSAGKPIKSYEARKVAWMLPS